MQNDNAKFKKEFKKRLYNFALKLIEFLDKFLIIRYVYISLFLLLKIISNMLN